MKASPAVGDPEAREIVTPSTVWGSVTSVATAVLSDRRVIV